MIEIQHSDGHEAVPLARTTYSSKWHSLLTSFQRSAVSLNYWGSAHAQKIMSFIAYGTLVNVVNPVSDGNC